MAVLLAMWGGYTATQKAITLSIDGRPALVHTHQRSVGGLLREIGSLTSSYDVIIPPLSATLQDGDSVTVLRARQVTVQADGRTTELMTHAATVQEVLGEMGLTLGRGDLLLVNGRPAPAAVAFTANPRAAEGVLSSPTGPQSLVMAAGRAVEAGLSDRGGAVRGDGPTTLALRRAVPVSLRQGSFETDFLTTGATVGEALRGQGITVYAGDRVRPPLDTPMSPGLLVQFEPAVPVSIVADGKTVHTRTQAGSVEEALTQEGFALVNKDFSQPEPISVITAGMTIRLTRVREEIVTEEESLPFTTVWEPDSGLELDERLVSQTGLEGIYKRRIHIVYEDGVQTKRLLEREWVDREPVTKVISYGTKVVIREAMTIDGPIQYWRKLRVLATWYNSSHGWFPRGSPYYGMTRTGLYATRGIVAVDPNVIRLHTHMYVPGYGFGAAEDTGGLIKGMRIDLAYDEGDPLSGAPGWITIYLLPPAPPAGQIQYILPDYP